MHRSEDVARRPHVAHRQRFEDLSRSLPLGAQGPDVVVVDVAPRHRLLEDGGIGRHPAETVLLDQPRQLAGGDEVPGDVVVPGALPEVAEFHEGIGGCSVM